MNAFQITLQSAQQTLVAVIRKGIKDVVITLEFFTDPEMVKMYRIVWQSLYGVAMLVIGLVLVGINALVEDSLAPKEETPVERQEERPVEPKLENYVTDWKDGIVPILLEDFKNIPNREKARILRERGLPYREKNRRFNSVEMLEIYREYLYSL